MFGIDAVEIERIKNAVKAESGERFLQKVYTDKERAYCTSGSSFRFDSLAARFAAKEAVAKALGTGVRGFVLTDIEILNDELGCPSVTLYNNALKRAAELNVEQVCISLSHTSTTAFAGSLLIKRQ